MKGIVSCVRHGAGNTYTIISPENGKIIATETRSDLMLNPGELVEVGEKVEPVPEDPSQCLSLAGRLIEESIEKAVRSSPYATGIRGIDGTTERMWSRLMGASKLFLKKLMAGAPVIIRFHNDADGSSGAIGVYRGVQAFAESASVKPNIIWIMHRGVTYGARDAEWDTLVANNYSSMEKPLLMIIDFGTSIGSNEGISAVREKFDVIWLDHHPMEEGFAGEALPHYINPWAFGGESSYTAGLLACVFSHTFSDSETGDLERASLIGDCSILAPQENAGIAESTILDLLTSDPRIVAKSNGNLTPSEMESALNDKERRSELYSYAKMRMEEVLDAALRSVKASKAGGAGLFVLDYGELRAADTKYPLPGRFASRLLVRIEEIDGRPSMVIVHHNSYISMRVSGGISDRIDIPGIISHMKEMHAEAIESGGGHKNAASIKVSREGNKKEIIRSIMERVRANLGQAEDEEKGYIL